MGFVFHPLDAGAVALRKYAQRLANTLPGQRGVANRIQDGYLLRAVGDGSTVTVTVIPLPAVIGGAFNAALLVGVYPGTSTPEQKHVVFNTFASGKLVAAVFLGKDQNLAGTGDYRRYIASGRATVGTVTQLWPLGFIGDVNDGWLRSPPEFTVQGQCRLGSSGAIDAEPWATRAVPCRTALLTLHTPIYREAYYVGAAPNPTHQEHTVTLCRLNASTGMVTWGNVAPGNPPAIKLDMQADYTAWDGGSSGRGLIEISTGALGVDINPTGLAAYSTEGNVRPLGCFEWGRDTGCVAITVQSRTGVGRISLLRYNMTSSNEGAVVWQRTILPATPGASTVLQSVADGLWATRAGRGYSSGAPGEPDTIIALAVECVYKVYTTRLWVIAPDGSSASSVVLGQFDREPTNTAGALTEYAYYHALGVTVGAGAAQKPMFVCCRRTIPYWLQTVEGTTTRIAQAFNRTGADETHLVSVSDTGAITVLDTGANFPAYFFSSSDVVPSLGDSVPRRLGFACLRDVLEAVGQAGYDAPVCEFAPGYVAALVAPRGSFAATDWSLRIVVCDVVSGAKVYESGPLPIGTMQVGSYASITCAAHGTVTAGVAAGGTLLVTLRRASSMDAASGCFATRDLGVTFNRVLSADVPGSAMHYLGSPLKPTVIGGGQ